MELIAENGKRYLDLLSFESFRFACPHTKQSVEVTHENVSFTGHQGCLIVAEVKCSCIEGNHWINLGCW